jgi:hypothetical protein
MFDIPRCRLTNRSDCPFPVNSYWVIKKNNRVFAKCKHHERIPKNDMDRFKEITQEEYEALRILEE